jgi:hypothetical protein
MLNRVFSELVVMKHRRIEFVKEQKFPAGFQQLCQCRNTDNMSMLSRHLISGQVSQSVWASEQLVKKDFNTKPVNCLKDVLPLRPKSINSWKIT